MKHVTMNDEGDLICPVCGAKQQFSYRRTRGAKFIAGVSVGVGALAVPKRLQCLGCKEYLKSPAVPATKPAGSMAAPATARTSVAPGLHWPVGSVPVLVSDCQWDGPARDSMLRSAVPGLTPGGYQRILNGLLMRRPTEVASLTQDGAREMAARLTENGFTVDTPATMARAAPAPSAEEPKDLLDELERLGNLRERGILTDEEFTAQKAKLLG